MDKLKCLGALLLGTILGCVNTVKNTEETSTEHIPTPGPAPTQADPIVDADIKPAATPESTAKQTETPQNPAEPTANSAEEPKPGTEKANKTKPTKKKNTMPVKVPLYE